MPNNPLCLPYHLSKVLGQIWANLVQKRAFWRVSRRSDRRYGRTVWSRRVGPPPYRCPLTDIAFCESANSVLSILAAISSYELRFGCSSARWNCMDESYNTMVLDFHFEMMMQKSPFPTPHMAKSGGCSYSILSHLCPFLPCFIHKSP